MCQSRMHAEVTSGSRLVAIFNSDRSIVFRVIKDENTSRTKFFRGFDLVTKEGC